MVGEIPDISQPRKQKPHSASVRLCCVLCCIYQSLVTDTKVLPRWLSTPTIAAGIVVGIAASVTASAPSGVVSVILASIIVVGTRLLKVGISLEVKVLGVLGDVLLEEVGNLLAGLKEGPGEDRGKILVTLRVKRGGKASVSDTASTADAVGILLDAAIHGRGQVEIDDVQDVAHINAASGDAGGDQHGGPSGTEGAHGSLTLPLGSVAVHADTGDSLVEQEIVELISSALVVDEDDGASRRHRVQQVETSLLLQVRLNPDDVLFDVCMGAAGTSNAKTHVVVSQMGPGKVAGRLGEGGREQHVFDVAFLLICGERDISLSPSYV